MKAIIFGTSLSGKTTTIRYLRKNTKYNISEIDEELMKINGGVFPENAKQKHHVLAPRVIKQILSSNNILFFTNTDYFSDQQITNAKRLGFKIIQLSVPLDELVKRNRGRVENGGYDDLSCWLDGMVQYQDHIFKQGFVDQRIDATKSTSQIVEDLLDYLSE